MGRSLIGQALMGWVLVGHALMGRALVSQALMAQPFWPPWAIFVVPQPMGPKQLMSHPCMYICIYIYVYNTHEKKKIPTMKNPVKGPWGWPGPGGTAPGAQR